MMAHRLADLLLTLHFELRRTFGVPGLVGALALGVAALTWTAIPTVEAQTRGMLDSARQARTAKTRYPGDAGRAPAEVNSLGKLPALFTTFADSGNDIAVIFSQARESHLTLGSAQYQIVTEPGAGFTHYQVVLPVKDQYGTIRRFVASVLNSVPNAALQEIHVERPAVDGNVLEARIRFDLIYRASRP
ncbi:hypothetical protein OR16_11653 [Cupriavidus basilensis OR16]|uniref:Transmembrane protein n=1 Tax=Cupriavidus basilensis OR16 TaxID=1127483 RepID=H1S3K4_9BURK|nr:hypothetical protein [Cupriavidus basilensis]EHP42905.1 hypothetical protein OR16_11653 [Cupriavidus basilensis OR16]